MQLRDSLTYTPAELSFGTSGLRGLVADMTDLECYINATGFLEFLRGEDGLDAGDIVYLAGDLRDSTPRIMSVMSLAIQDAGFEVVNCGLIPTPALAFYASQHNAPCIMVTGSHIPKDRNGIKFYKRGGEVLKSDEAAIHAFVANSRREQYEQESERSKFNTDGSCKYLLDLPPAIEDAAQVFIKRYTDIFDATTLKGKRVIVYQHSAVGRDLLVDLLESLGAEAVPVERSDTFISIDTENVTEVEHVRFKSFSEQFPDAFAIVSTDGDSDRPFVIDEKGEFHRGDVLGCVVADFLKARFAAVPISANDAVDEYCAQQRMRLVHTRIGSPYVIEEMQTVPENEWPVVGWEVNGGFLTGADITINKKTLQALPTRDAILPILSALISAAQQKVVLSALFAKLPARYTGAGLIDVSDNEAQEFRAVSSDEKVMLNIAQKLFASTELGVISRVDVTDGLRMIFASSEVLHLRASGNAPQLRVYTNTDSQQRADELVEKAISPNGYIEELLQAIVHHREY